MITAGVVTGVVGEIRWHYYPAASINNYAVTRLTKDGRQWALSAIVVLANAYNLAQRPLTFVAKVRGGEWRWPIESLDQQVIHGIPRLTARLGPPTSQGGR